MMGHHMVANSADARHDLVVNDVVAKPRSDEQRCALGGLTQRRGSPERDRHDVAAGAEGSGAGRARRKRHHRRRAAGNGVRRSQHQLADAHPSNSRGPGRARIQVADAPVSGGVAGAEDASLQIMVGCDAEVFERITPALRSIGDKIAHIGDVGAGEVAKLCHNQLALVVQQAVAEALTLGTKAGIRPEKLLEAIRGGAYGRSRAASGRVSRASFCRPIGIGHALRWRWRARTSGWQPTSPASSVCRCR